MLIIILTEGDPCEPHIYSWYAKSAVPISRIALYLVSFNGQFVQTFQISVTKGSDRLALWCLLSVLKYLDSHSSLPRFSPTRLATTAIYRDIIWWLQMNPVGDTSPINNVSPKSPFTEKLKSNIVNLECVDQARPSFISFQSRSSTLSNTHPSYFPSFSIETVALSPATSFSHSTHPAPLNYKPDRSQVVSATAGYSTTATTDTTTTAYEGLPSAFGDLPDISLGNTSRSDRKSNCHFSSTASAGPPSPEISTDSITPYGDSRISDRNRQRSVSTIDTKQLAGKIETENVLTIVLEKMDSLRVSRSYSLALQKNYKTSSISVI